MSAPKFSNRLLQVLSPSDRALLIPALEPTTLDLRQMIEAANETIEFVHFPETGIISIVAKSAGDQIEAGIVGREGVSGTAIIMGNHRSANEAYVQVAGHGHRIHADKFRKALGASETLRRKLQLYVHVFFTQVAQTALANGRSTIEERLARWLLMAQDRLDDQELRLTHEFIAVMLGVRRPGVTDALHELEGKNLIRSTRGAVRVTDRAGLEQLAGGGYGVPEAEYKRLIG